MRDQQQHGHRQVESVICESDLSFEVLDMLAQANIDFRRLPAEELQNLMGAGAIFTRDRIPAFSSV